MKATEAIINDLIEEQRIRRKIGLIIDGLMYLYNIEDNVAPDRDPVIVSVINILENHQTTLEKILEHMNE